MRAVVLSHEDSSIFGTELTSSRSEFLKNNMKSFMTMYKTQGPTFWLRLILSFRCYIEEKFFVFKKHPKMTSCCIPFIKVLNYILINIHTNFIEASNTSFKKFIGNLSAVGLSSPQYKKLEPREWIAFLKSAEIDHSMFNNLLGLPDLTQDSDPNKLTLAWLVYTVYADFFSSLCSVFEKWYSLTDLNEGEVIDIDTMRKYWLPNAIIKPTDKKSCINLSNTPVEGKPFHPSSCFEKYLVEYWKDNLQKMILGESIHFHFECHDEPCICNDNDLEKNIFNVLKYPNDKTRFLFKVWIGSIFKEDSKQIPENEDVLSITFDLLYVVYPSKLPCLMHENCFVKINHKASCLSPYVCDGSALCIRTCDTKLKKKCKSAKVEKFWKKLSVDLYPVKNNKRDVSTFAESCCNHVVTYYHCSSSFSTKVAEMIPEICGCNVHNCKMKRVHRLKNKLKQKRFDFSHSPMRIEDLKDEIYHKRILKRVNVELEASEGKYCIHEKNHQFPKNGPCECFIQLANSIAIQSTELYGRVVILKKTPMIAPEASVSDDNKIEAQKIFNTYIESNRCCTSEHKNSNSISQHNGPSVNVRMDNKLSSEDHSIESTKNLSTASSKHDSNFETSDSDIKSNSSLNSTSNNSQDFKNNSVHESKIISSSYSIDSVCTFNTVLHPKPVSKKAYKNKLASVSEYENSGLAEALSDMENLKKKSITENSVSKNNESISSGSKNKLHSKNKPDVPDIRKKSTTDHISDPTSISCLSNTAVKRNSADALKISITPEQNSTLLSNISMKNDSEELDLENFDEIFKFIKPDLPDFIKKYSTNHISDPKNISMCLSNTAVERNSADALKISVTPKPNSTVLGNISMKNDPKELPLENFDEFIKFIKADQCEENDQQHDACEIKNNKELVHESLNCSTSPKDEARVPVKSSKYLKQGKLRICAFCQKKETEKKTFKRCSRCKEENFPVHRYYCSRDCLVEDWTESHQAEHLKKQENCT